MSEITTIEINQKVVTSIIGVIAVIIFIIMGIVVSPKTETGKPLILSSEIRDVEAYINKTKDWVAILTNLEKEMGRILNSNSVDIFALTGDINNLATQIIALSGEIESSRTPLTLYGLNSLLLQSLGLHIQALEAVSQSINEPSDIVKNNAADKLFVAIELQERVYSNPWLLDEPGAKQDMYLLVPTLITTPTQTLTITPEIINTPEVEISGTPESTPVP